MVDELPKRKSLFQSKMMMDSLVFFKKIVLNQVSYLALLKNSLHVPICKGEYSKASDCLQRMHESPLEYQLKKYYMLFNCFVKSKIS